MGYIGNSPAKNEAVDTAQLASPLSGDLTVAGTLGTTGDTAAGDDAAVGYTAAEGLILTGQGSTDDVTIKNDADTTVLNVPTGTSDIEISAGDIIFGTAGKGINLGVTSNTDSNTLDDYEEGTWTPAAGTQTGSWTSTGGNYIKIGNIVIVHGELTKVTTGSNDSVTGFPFTNGAEVGHGSGAEVQVTGGNLVVRIYANAAQGAMRQSDPANGNEWGDGSVCQFTVVYQT